MAGAAAVLGTLGIGGSSAQRNLGEFPHNFTIIRGPRRFASATLEGGRSARVTRTPPAGAYLAICTVRDGGHMAAGMVKTFHRRDAGSGDRGMALGGRPPRASPVR